MRRLWPDGWENPVLLREARALSRSPATPVALTAYLAAVGGVSLTLFSMAAVGSPGHHPGVGQLARVAYHATSLQIVLVVLVAPALAARAVSGERERGTFDLLVVGDLTAWSIVAAKLVATVSYVLLFAVAALPLYVAVFLHAGLGLGPLAVAELLTATTAIGGAALGIFLSAVCQRTSTATAAACALALALCLDVVLSGLVPAPGTGLPQTRSQLLAGLGGKDTTAIPTGASGAPLPPRQEHVIAVRLANPLYAADKAITDPHPAVDPGGVPVARALRSLVPGDKSWSTWGLRIRPWQLSVVTALASSLLLLAGAARLVSGPRRGGRRRGSGPAGPSASDRAEPEGSTADKVAVA